MKVSVLYEDNHLLIVEKPVNVPVQADASNDLDFLTMLKQDIKVRYEKPGNVYLGLIHRLDRPVGGVMVFAKTSKAASRLSNELRKKQIKRTYLAVVRGVPHTSKGMLTDYLYKDRQKNKVHVVRPHAREAKKAILEYELLQSKDGLSLVRVELKTGRSHQIRVQLSHASLPIVGDQKYGAKHAEKGQQIALWAHELEVKHPTKDLYILEKSNPPQSYPWANF